MVLVPFKLWVALDEWFCGRWGVVVFFPKVSVYRQTDLTFTKICKKKLIKALKRKCLCA